MNKVRYILIIIFFVIVSGILLYINYHPSQYKFVEVNYKFVKNNNYYIIGKTTSPDKYGEIDIYQVSNDFYKNALEGFEYSISTSSINQWRYFNKKVVDWYPMIYD